MVLSLDAPIEDLKLSNRVRNVLRRRGFDTLGSLLGRDYKPALRGFGPAARAELASALASNGFALPAILGIDCHAFGEDASKLPAVVRHPRQGNSVAGGALAQEFNTPLTVIRAASACLLLATKLNARQRELVVLVEEESVRLSRLLCQIFDSLLLEKTTSWPTSAQRDVRKPANRAAFAGDRAVTRCEFQQQVIEPARPLEPEEARRPQFDKGRLS